MREGGRGSEAGPESCGRGTRERGAPGRDASGAGAGGAPGRESRGEAAGRARGGRGVEEEGPSPAAGHRGEAFSGEGIRVVVEIPKGSRNKYEFDPASGRFFLDRMLFSSVHYPADYGFIPDTEARDGDAMDALVLVGEATFPGCVIEVRPVGVFEMRDEKGPDEKILCVPFHDPQWNWIRRLEQVPVHLLREIEHFFEVYKDLEGKETEVGGWRDQEAARGHIEDGRRRWREKEGAEG